jgi:general secretion pathway protein E
MVSCLQYPIRRWLCRVVLCLGVAVACYAPEAVRAQQPPPTANGAAGNTPAGNAGGENAAPPAPTMAPIPKVVDLPPGQYPPNQFDFYRGNNPPGNSSLRQIGWYLNLVLLIPVIGLLFLWAKTTQWVAEDAKGLRMVVAFWNPLVMFCGALGFIALLLVPNTLGSLFLLAVAYGAPLGSYITERNRRVPESSRVMTPKHIKKMCLQALARVGIHMGSRERGDYTSGPPIKFLGKNRSGKGVDTSTSKSVESSRGYLAAKEMIYDAILRRATDVHLEPHEDELAIRYRIDGVMYPAEPFDRTVGDAIVNIFKVLSAMDITERRKPQDGSFRAETEGREIDFRVATQGTQIGEKMSLRILDQSNSVRTLNDLGMRKALSDQITDIINQPHVMILSCGPTGAGKSTTLFAALSGLDVHQINIITIEDPVEYRMSGVTQIEINTKAGQTFAGSLRSVLRQDPDVVLIGEMRDDETTRIACQAANTGHMVFSTVHANDSISALFRILDLGVEPFMLASALSAILGQRLVRRLCEECKESYKPDPDILKKNNLPPEQVKQFFRPPTDGHNNCAACGGLGYKGRVGVYELLVINDRLRDLIRENPQLSVIKAEARKNGMLYLKEEGLRLVVKGITSMDELMRVVK